MPKPTPAQSAEIHIFASGVLAILAGFATSVYSGNQGLGVALGALTASLGVSFVSIMHAMMSSPEATQAEDDTASQLATWIDARITTSEQRVMAWIQSFHAPAPAPVVPIKSPLEEDTQSMPAVKLQASAQ